MIGEVAFDTRVRIAQERIDRFRRQCTPDVEYCTEINLSYCPRTCKYANRMAQKR